VSEPSRTKRLVAFASGLARAGHFSAAAHVAGMALTERRDLDLTAFVAALSLDAGDPYGASEQLEAGARVHGWSSETKYLRVLAAARLGRFEEAVALARQLVKDPTRGQDAQLLLVHFLLETGDVVGARRAAEVARQERPSSVDPLLAQARVAEREGEMNEQLAVLERARRIDPDNIAVRTSHGMALLKAGARADGQRELARVVAEKPGDPVARNALLRSTISSQRARSGLRAVLLTPAKTVLVVWLIASLLGRSAPHWLPSLYFGTMLLVIVGIQVFDRVRTDRSVSAIRRDARRRVVRGAARFPTLQPVRWLLVALVAGLWISFAVAAAFFNREPGSTRVVPLLLSLPGWLVFVTALWHWRRRRVQIARGEPRSFDPSSCHCRRVTSVSGSRAKAYVERHLVFEAATGVHGITEHRCDLLGVRWLCFSQPSGLPGILPVALRLPDDFIPPTEDNIADLPTGFYL
jgi:tetratricopeptide (TPR) repeat protein